MQNDIHKAGGILIRDGKLLVERSRGKDHFIAPGGQLEGDETAQQALIRELIEEFQIEVSESDLEEFGTFFAQAATDQSRRVQMDVFLVKTWNGEINPDHEVEEIRWVDSTDVRKLNIGSIFAHDVIPRLKEKGLID